MIRLPVGTVQVLVIITLVIIILIITALVITVPVPSLIILHITIRHLTIRHITIPHVTRSRGIIPILVLTLVPTLPALFSVVGTRLDHTHSGSYSSSYSSKHYHSHSNAHQNSPDQGVHQSWQKSSVSGTYGYHTGSGYTSSGTHYSSGYHTQFNALSHHAVKHSVMNCSSSDDISVVKIWPDGDIWWKGSSKGSLQGIYIKNGTGGIVAKFVDHRVWLWSGDRYVDVGYAQNAQEAVYDVCVKYRALGS